MGTVLVVLPLLWLSSYYSASLVAGSYASEFASITGINPFLEQALAAIFIAPIYIGTIWLFSGSRQKHLAGVAIASLLVFSYNLALYVATLGTNFDPATGQVRQWYHMHPEGTCEFFPRDGYHPKYGDKLKPVTGEIAKACEARERARSVRDSRSSSTDTSQATWGSINHDLPVAVAAWAQGTAGWLAKYWPLLMVAGLVPFALLRLRGGRRTTIALTSLALLGWLVIASWREGARTINDLGSTMTNLLHDCGKIQGLDAGHYYCAGLDIGQTFTSVHQNKYGLPAYPTRYPDNGARNWQAQGTNHTSTTTATTPAYPPYVEDRQDRCPPDAWRPPIGQSSIEIWSGEYNEILICSVGIAFNYEVAPGHYAIAYHKNLTYHHDNRGRVLADTISFGIEADSKSAIVIFDVRRR